MKKFINLLLLGILLIPVAHSETFMGTVNTDINVHVTMNGIPVAGQQIFYSIYDQDKKSFVKENALADIHGNVFDIKFIGNNIVDYPQSRSPICDTNKTDNGNYMITVYGMQYRGLDVGIPIKLSYKNKICYTIDMHSGGGGSTTDYFTYIIPSLELQAHPSLNMQQVMPLYEGDKNSTKACPLFGVDCKVINIHPIKKITYQINENLAFELDNYVGYKLGWQTLTGGSNMPIQF